MDRRLETEPPRDPDLEFRWMMYALLVTAVAIRFGPTIMDLLQ